ncbi:hypothetical protein BWI17_04860 [Betaproteobacteria bacterium GR16-43]|nr:hypothetical protein BWI17_04860 [Betaproteobacteria bacterium GR16-43]
MDTRKPLLALLAVAASTAAMGNYVGTLRAPQAFLTMESSPYAFSAPGTFGVMPSLTDPGFRLKLGYQATRYLSIESEFVDFGRPGASPFQSPANLSSQFRSTGFGVDAVASLPMWNKFSLYGRLGAYRGDSRPMFAPYTASLMVDSGRGTRMRYGLGASYDFTKAFGIRAEFERFSPLTHPLPTDAEADQISVGVLWRF